MSSTLDVFISYSWKDSTFVEDLATRLKKSGVSLWLDRYEIKPGEYLRHRVNEAIASADYSVVIISPDSIKSEWVQHEIDGAMSRELDEKKVRLIPLLIGNVQSRDLPADIRGKNYLDFRVPDEAVKAFDRLVDFLKPELRIRGALLEDLRSGLPASKNPVHDLEEVLGQYGDQTLQRAALRGLEVIGTAEALLAITERMVNKWGCNTLKSCAQALLRLRKRGGLVALGSTVFWDERFMMDKLYALERGLAGQCDLGEYLRSQSSSYGTISWFAVLAAMREHTTPEIAAAFEFSCEYLPHTMEQFGGIRPLFLAGEIESKRILLEAALPGLADLIQHKLPSSYAIIPVDRRFIP